VVILLGDNIKKIRESKKYSINFLARKCNMSVGYLSDLEKNKKDNPSKDMLQKIADALEVPISSFFDDDMIDDFTISDVLKNMLSEAIGIPSKDFFKLTGSFVLFNSEINKIKKLTSVFQKHILETVNSDQKSYAQLLSGKSLELRDIAKSIIYNADNKTINIEIKYPEKFDSFIDKANRIGATILDLPTLDNLIRNTESISTLAASRIDGYDDDLPEEAKEELRNFIEYLKVKYKKKDSDK